MEDVVLLFDTHWIGCPLPVWNRISCCITGKSNPVIFMHWSSRMPDRDTGRSSQSLPESWTLRALSSAAALKKRDHIMKLGALPKRYTQQGLHLFSVPNGRCVTDMHVFTAASGFRSENQVFCSRRGKNKHRVLQFVNVHKFWVGKGNLSANVFLLFLIIYLCFFGETHWSPV